METEELFGLALVAGIIINITLADKIKALEKTVSEIPTKLLALITNPIFIISAIVICLAVSIFLIIRHRNLCLGKERLEVEYFEEKKLIERNVRRLLNRNIEGLNSNEIEKFIEILKKYDNESRIRSKIIEVKKGLGRVEIREYQKTKRYEREKLLQEIEELRQQKYLEELRLKDHHDAVLRKLGTEENLIYDIGKLNKKEIEVLQKEDYKKTNEYDPIECKNKTFFVKQILNHSPSHTFLIARIKQLLEKYISPNKIRTHDTKDADLTFEIKYKIYALEIETGTLLAKKKQLRKKVSLLNNKYGQNWYFVVINRDLMKKYREYGKVMSRMGVGKIIEKLAKN